MQKIGVVLLFLSFYFLSFAQSPPYCPPNLNSSFIKSYYELDSQSQTIKIYLNLLTENKDDSLAGPYKPIPRGYVLVNTQKENSAAIESSCYVVSDLDGKATASLKLSPGTCYSISLKFFPKADSSLLTKTNCQLQASYLPENYLQNYSGSFTQFKVCVPEQKNKTFSLCWFSTIVAGLIFVANFIMGRNPLMFFDFGVARNLPSRHLSATAYYSPMAKQDKPDSTSQYASRFMNIFENIASNLKELGNDFNKLKGKEDSAPTPQNESSNPNQTTNTQSGQPASADTNTAQGTKNKGGSGFGYTLQSIANTAASYIGDPIGTLSIKLFGESSKDNSSNKEEKKPTILSFAASAGAKGLVNMVAFAAVRRKSKFVPRAPFKGAFFKGLGKTGLELFKSSLVNFGSELYAYGLKSLQNEIQNSNDKSNTYDLGKQALSGLLNLGNSLALPFFMEGKKWGALKTGNRDVDDIINLVVNQTNKADSIAQISNSYSLFLQMLRSLNRGG
ncbi:MAG: hypothetical protein N3D10_02215 [Candidatus Micrarchaeota archaeon]|nr:hypothetical protein [Candidatus Micrarchaeota archaeon]